jgi:hypothetical protein
MASKRKVMVKRMGWLIGSRKWDDDDMWGVRVVGRLEVGGGRGTPLRWTDGLVDGDNRERGVGWDGGAVDRRRSCARSRLAPSTIPHAASTNDLDGIDDIVEIIVLA